MPKKGQIDFFNSQHTNNEETLQNDSILSGKKHERVLGSQSKLRNSSSANTGPKRSSSASYPFKNSKANQLEPLVSHVDDIKLEDH